MTPKERAAMQQALGALVRAEAMYGQPNADIQTALREALAEQAEQDLDTCPGCGGVADNGHDREFPPNLYYCTKCTEQVKQEPVAEVVLRNQTVGFGRTEERRDIVFLADVEVGTKLYAKSQQQAEQEPVVKIHKYNEFQTLDSLNLPIGTKLYAAPVRTKDLTDDEIRELWSDAELDITWFARAVIAADREKNRG